MRVFFHTRSPGQQDWRNLEKDWRHIPRVGEYVSLTKEGDSGEGNPDWHRVEVVVWVHQDVKTTYEVEVFAVRQPHLEAMREFTQG